MGNTGNGINVKNILTFSNYEKQLIIEKSDQQTMTHEPDLAFYKKFIYVFVYLLLITIFTL